MGCEVQQVTLCLILVNRFFSRFSVWTWVQSSMFSAVAQTFEVVSVWVPDAHAHAQFIFSLSSDTQESDALIHKSARVIAGSTRGWLKRRGFVWTRGLDCVRMFRGSYNVLMCSLTALEPSFSCFCFRTLVHTGHQQHQSPGLSLRLFCSYSFTSCSFLHGLVDEGTSNICSCWIFCQKSSASFNINKKDKGFTTVMY